jgi:hypothetical protein
MEVQEGSKTEAGEPIEEMEKLEHEDAQPMRHLSGSDSAGIFADLQARARVYPKRQTTF